MFRDASFGINLEQVPVESSAGPLKFRLECEMSVNSAGTVLFPLLVAGCIVIVLYIYL